MANFKKRIKQNAEKNRPPVDKTRSLVEAGLIAALYVVLTLISFQFGLANGPLQVRISEALCILPCFTVAAVPGLFLGCLIANIISGSVIWDVIFGSLATLLAAFCTRQLKHNRFLACLPPIVVNSFVIPLVLVKAMGIDMTLAAVSLYIAISEILSAGLLGQILYSVLKRNKQIFKG